jgi:hypothetical protein
MSFTDINNLTPFNSKNILGNKNCYGFNHLIKLNRNGNIIVNDNPDEFLPILTLSTNTDAGRDLKSDSFAILKFENDINTNFIGCVDSDSDDEYELKLKRSIYNLAKMSYYINNKLSNDTYLHNFLKQNCLSKIQSKKGGSKINELNLEIYEFLLKGYPNFNGPFNIKTESISYSTSVDECGIVKLDKIINNEKENIRSCDLINSTLIDSTEKISLQPSDNPKYDFTLDIRNSISIKSSDLIKFTNIYPAKIDERIKVDYLKDRIPSLEPLYESKSINYILNEATNIMKQNWFDNNNKIYRNQKEQALVRIIVPDKNNKYVIMGDFHGSIATFIRHLLRFRRLGIIDENCVIMDNYNLIFLGDIVDRGTYGYEIMMILYCLLIKNPNNVFINRGNHEEMETNSDPNNSPLLTQLKTQFGNNIRHTDINNVMEYQSSAILIKNPIDNKFIYLCHGGLPVKLLEDNSLGLSVVLDDLDKINKSTSGWVSEVTGSNIRWSDFTNNINSKTNPNRARGSAGYLIGLDLLQDAKDKNISLIIRGHNDSQNNTKLIRK